MAKGFIVALDHHGNSVTRLTADDFILLDDGQAQTIQDFAAVSGYAAYTGSNIFRE
jgi:hypothetical protein